MRNSKATEATGSPARNRKLSHHATAYDALRHYAHQSDGNLLAEVALAAVWMAKWMQPEVSVAAYLRHLDTLSKDAARYVADDVNDAALAIEAARQILSRRYGYNLLDDVGERHMTASMCLTIDRRRGSPMTLALLYVHVFHGLGWDVEILDFPARTLVGLLTPHGRRIVDPCDGSEPSPRDLRRLCAQDDGGEASQDALRPDGLRAIGARDALLALNHDIKVHHLRQNAPEAALHAVSGAVVLAPDAAEPWRELGLLHERLDHIEDAITAFERVLYLPGGERKRYIASQKLQSLRRRLDAMT